MHASVKCDGQHGCKYAFYTHMSTSLLQWVCLLYTT